MNNTWLYVVAATVVAVVPLYELNISEKVSEHLNRVSTLAGPQQQHVTCSSAHHFLHIST